MANTPDTSRGVRFISRPGEKIASLDPVHLPDLGSALASFYNGCGVDSKISAGEIAIAMSAGAEILPLVQNGGAFTHRGVASAWSYDAIYRTLHFWQQQKLVREGHIQIRATHTQDLFGIQDPDKPEGIDPSESIHIISPNLPQKLQVVSTGAGFRIQYKKAPNAPDTREYVDLQVTFESAIKGLTHLVENKMLRPRSARRSVFTGPWVSANTVVRAVFIECIANS